MAYMFDQGKFVDDRIDSVSVRNKALNYGLGCLEGIRAFWNEDQQQLYVFRLHDHMKRLHTSANSLYMNVPYTIGQLNEITVELLRKNRIRQDVYIRPICFNGEDAVRPGLLNDRFRVSIFLVPLTYQPKPFLKTKISSWTRMGNNMIPPQVKSTAGYLNAALAINEANLGGYDEAIFINDEGNISEGATENIFTVINGKFITPPISDDVLPGITRDTVIQVVRDHFPEPLAEGSISRVEVYNSDEVFFTGTAIGIKPVTEVDHRVIGNGGAGPLTLRLQQIYHQTVYGLEPNYRHFLTPVY